jgi:hypothetical protein
MEKALLADPRSIELEARKAEVDAERACLVAELHGVQGELSRITGQIRGKGWLPNYRALCDRQSVLKQRISEIATLLAGIKLRRQELNREENQLLREAAAEPKGQPMANRLEILAEVGVERYEQDVTHGGYPVDCLKTPSDWIALITRHAGLAADDGTASPTDLERYRRQMVRVAALAVAAVETLDRMTAAVAPPGKVAGILRTSSPENG